MRKFVLPIAFILPSLACSLGQNSPTATPQPTASQTTTATPSAVPFPLYGEAVADLPYCTAGASLQKLDLYFPDSGGPWPVLAYVHGGSWMHGDKTEALLFVDRMTSEGYLVASINYRLYPEGKFPNMIEDVKCAIRFLRAHASEYNLNPNRIAAIGPSAGGHLVSLLGTSDVNAGWDVGEYLDQSSRVQAVVAMAPVTDLTRSFPNADIEAMRGVGFGEDNIVQASPVTHVTTDDPPFLLIHGDQDTVVPFEQSQLMYDRLVQASVPAQLVAVQRGGHSFTAPDGSATPTFDEINQIIITFLAQHLN
ncbi:MAG TPA: alpha/beta hydrolase fold domain-containing protein [Anaerolineales bacterium]|nr:alpha/beta hydrolase fold domain-containing protein [Anaerolineales bacterium]